jgi:prevent-host-death family protein
MARVVGAYEAKTRLSHLLEEVERGEMITISRHGVPVAMLVPAGPRQRRAPGEVIAGLREARRGIRLRGLALRALIERGRR